jgi:nucleoside-diphosphate-sugar epimerase
VDAIYHLGAAFQGGGPFTTEEYFEINVRGTINVLEAARAQSGLRHLVFASTDAVYDKYVPGGMAEPIREVVTPRRPRGWYALSKSVGEELCNGYHRTYRLPVTVLRFPNVLGAGEVLRFRQFRLSALRTAQPDLAPLWQGEERLVLLRDPNGRPYKKHVADVRDVVHGCVSALGKEAAIGHTLQLGGPGPFTWDEAVPYLSERTGIPFVDATSTAIPTYYEYDLSEARERIGFAPRYDIRRMIDDALAFQRGEDIGVLPTA